MKLSQRSPLALTNWPWLGRVDVPASFSRQTIRSALIKPDVVFSVIFGGGGSPTCNTLIQGWKAEASLDRTCLSDEQWGRVSPLLPGKIGGPGRSGADNRQFLEAILWMVRTGSPWRDLPDSYGNWNSTFQRFRRLGRFRPAPRPIEELVVAGEIACLHPSCHAQAGGDRALARSEHSAHDDHQHALPIERRETGLQDPQPAA